MKDKIARALLKNVTEFNKYICEYKLNLVNCILFRIFCEYIDLELINILNY